MKCFDKGKKMADKVKMIEKHLNIISQTHQKMRNLQEKIIELDEWRSTKKDIPNSLPTVKSYNITVYTMATEECQDLASWFEENARKDLAGMMDLYEKTTYDIQRYIQWPEINFEENHPVPITVFEEIKKDFERAPCKAINGVLPLQRICTKVCDQYGGVPEMQHSTRHKESPYLQLEGGKDMVAIRSMQQTFSKEMKMKIVIF